VLALLSEAPGRTLRMSALATQADGSLPRLSQVVARLEQRGWIAEATCCEVRIGLPDNQRMEYAVAEWRNKYRIASENPAKEDIVERLLEQHEDKNVLIIGQYLRQLRSIKKRFDLPLITGRLATGKPS